jgi:uridine kinase
MGAYRAQKGQGQPKLIAIIGGSGSGKTFLAQMLHQALGRKAARLALDDFYRDRSGCHPARRARINFDHPRAIDWAELETVLKNLAAGRAALAPRYDFSSHTRRPVRRRVRPRPLVLVEGLWPCHKKSVRQLFDFLIFLDCPEKTRLQRRLDRDVAERGRSPQSVRKQFYQTVAPMHVRFVKPQKHWSDLVIRRPISGPEIARLAQTIKKLEQTKKETV